MKGTKPFNRLLITAALGACTGCSLAGRSSDTGPVLVWQEGELVVSADRDAPSGILHPLLDETEQLAALQRPELLPSPRLELTPEVQRQLYKFTYRDREFIESALPSYARYHGQISEIFASHGVPSELINLAIVESRFQADAKSHKGAVGLWQFMAQTARSFGLQIGRQDERLDPIRSSAAAARYLRHLYGELGDWYLALAAYNGGIGRVTRAMDEVGVYSFWDLARSGTLAKETADFVPRFIAISMIMNDPQQYGFIAPCDRSDGVSAGEDCAKQPLVLAADDTQA